MKRIGIDGILIFDDCLRLLIFVILVIFAKIDRLVSRQVAECSRDSVDAYLDKDNFIRTRKCEIIFWARKFGKVKIFKKMSRCLSDNDIHYILLRLKITYLNDLKWSEMTQY